MMKSLLSAKPISTFTKDFTRWSTNKRQQACDSRDIGAVNSRDYQLVTAPMATRNLILILFLSAAISIILFGAAVMVYQEKGNGDVWKRIVLALQELSSVVYSLSSVQFSLVHIFVISGITVTRFTKSQKEKQDLVTVNLTVCISKHQEFYKLGSELAQELSWSCISRFPK